MEKLTDKAYWDGTYRSRKPSSARGFDSFLNYSNRMILGKLRQIELANKQVLEIGAGDSLWLPYLAKAYPASRFTGVDYSERGCALLHDRTVEEGVDVRVVHQDMFAPQSDLHGQFDVVYSLGVVEHFDDLARVLETQRRYLKPGGVMFTLIPNMSGLLGTLTRAWNRAVYDKHNPHDRERFLQGHRDAGLHVQAGGYLGSCDFGVLASCFPQRKGLAWQCNRALIAGSVLGWWLEDRLGMAPTGRLLSPYIYAICR
jgi:2-polyprenyl-3-methyl-5-hydroxy-6-metoxy-1,4-benzoquinol methylase